MSATWFCEAHRLSTTTDCPACDDEMIRDLERYAKLPICHECKRTLREGETAWASDWKVIGTKGQQATVQLETRYACDDCEAKR